MPNAVALAVGTFFSTATAAVGGSVAAQAGAAAFGAWLGTAAFSVGVSVGLSLLFSPHGGGRAPGIKPSDGQQSIRQAVPGRIKSFGRVGRIWIVELGQ